MRHYYSHTGVVVVGEPSEAICAQRAVVFYPIGKSVNATAACD